MLNIFHKTNFTLRCLFGLQMMFLFGIVLCAQDQSSNDQAEQQVPQQDFNFGIGQGMPDMSKIGAGLGSGLNEILSSLSSSDFLGELETSKADEEEKELRKREQMLEALPQDLRVALDDVERKYTDFLRKVSIKNGLQDICSILKTKLKDIAEKKNDPKITEDVEFVIDLLVKFEKALFAGVFPQVPVCAPQFSFDDMFKNMKQKLDQGLNQGQSSSSDNSDTSNGPLAGLSNLFAQASGQGKKDADCPAVKFDVEDFDELFNSLERLLPVIKESADRNLISNLVNFRNIAMLLKGDDKVATMQCYFKYLTPFQKNASTSAREIKGIIDQKNRELSNKIREMILAARESDPETKKLRKQQSAYLYWKKELNKFVKCLNKLELLQKSAASVFIGKNSLFVITEYLYDLMEAFLACYKRDIVDDGAYVERNMIGYLANAVEHKRWWAIKAYECGATALLGYWNYMAQKGASANAKLNSHIFKDISIDPSKADPMQGILSMFTGGTQGGGVDPMSMISMIDPSILGPDGEKMQEKLLLFTSFLTAIRPKGVGKFGTWASILQKIAVAATYDNIMKHGVNLKEWEKWPGKMQAVRGELLSLGYYGIFFGNEYLQMAVNKFFPFFWPMCSKFSGGIVSQDLILQFMYKLFPIFVYSKNPLPNVANFKEQKMLMDIANSDQTVDTTLSSDQQLAARNDKFNNIFKQFDNSQCPPYLINRISEKMKTSTFEHPNDILFESCVKKLGEDLGIDDSTVERYCAFKRDGGHNVGSFERYCLESFFVSYIFSCFGSKIGQVVAKRCNKSLWNTVYKVADFAIGKTFTFLNKCSLLDDEESNSWNEIKENIDMSLDEAAEMIEQFIAVLTDPVSPYRQIIIQMLAAYRYISINENDVERPNFQKELNYKVIYFFLNLLYNRVSVITLGEAYELMNTYLTSTNQIELLTAYKNKLAAVVKSDGPGVINGNEILEDLNGLDKNLGSRYSDILAKSPENIDEKTWALHGIREILHKLKSEFSRSLVEKLKVNIFANTIGSVVIGPLLTQTIGNCVQSKVTVGDIASWGKSKAIQIKTLVTG